ncbi:MAG: hypothetical protein AAFS11_01700 [Planctomycetota bacterium]
MRSAFLLAFVLAVPVMAQRQSPLAPLVAESSAAILTHLADPSTSAPVTDADRLTRAVVLAMSERDADALVDAESAARIVAIAKRLAPGDARALAKLAMEEPRLVRRFVFQFDGPRDDPVEATRILFDLVDRFGAERVAEFDSLAVAIALVHDGFESRRVNENTVRTDEPGRLFAYFADNAGSLQIDPRRLPSDVLVFLVSATEHVDQLEWARATYGRDRNHGERFFEIQYDIEHFRTGQPKAVSLAPRYCIQAIRELGGVCADQAYFAEHVAKANGVPAAYMRGRSGEVSHAWLGYLRVGRGGYSWDFNAGRYDAYKGVRGATMDPQTLEIVTDGEMAMRASSIRLSDDDRWQAEAFAIAADRVAGMSKSEADELVGEVFEGRRAERTGDAADRVELLRRSVERRPGDPEAWRAFARLASTGDVQSKTIDTWLTAFERSGGRSSPDMLADIVEMLLGAVPETRGKIDVLEWAMPKLRGRSDLQAWVRLKQGEVFEAAGDRDNAWRAYDDVARRFLNEGPFAVEAIDRMLGMLERADRTGPDLELLKRSFAAAQPPFALGDFRRQSNWYQIGRRYAASLERAGRSREAVDVQRQLGG